MRLHNIIYNALDDKTEKDKCNSPNEYIYV